MVGRWFRSVKFIYFSNGVFVRGVRWFDIFLLFFLEFIVLNLGFFIFRG